MWRARDMYIFHCLQEAQFVRAYMLNLFTNFRRNDDDEIIVLAWICPQLGLLGKLGLVSKCQPWLGHHNFKVSHYRSPAEELGASWTDIQSI
jgi:hypothetical protein